MNDANVFGLSRSKIRSVLAAACGQTVTEYSVRLSRRESTDGICGEYLVGTFAAQTECTGTVEIPMFVRRQLRRSVGKRQAHHYEFLGSQGVPVPLLYGSLIDAEEREIIFVELLNPVQGSDEELLARDEYLEGYLQLAASFCAARPTMDYVSQLGRALGRRDWVMNWAVWLPWSVYILDRVEQHAQSGNLGDGLKEYCSRNAVQLSHLRQIILALMTAVRALPVGLVHGDLRPGNTGWRKQSGQLVVFDFEDVMLDARFYDVAQVLGGPRPLRKGTRSNADLAESFLRTYTQLSGERVDLNTFMNEIQIAWAARKANLWQYLPHELGGPAYDNTAFTREKGRRCELLWENLSLLIESCPMLASILGRSSSATAEGT